ncbi:MAG: MmgE/PrpD family protein [Chloroflexi bacterium]|nr:MmgE/PrpD family protein [Chloroflexota bacterium]
MAIRDQLAEFACNLRFEDLPRDVVDFTWLLIAGQVGMTTVSIHVDPEIRAGVYETGIPAYFKEMGGKKESTLATQGCKVPCLNAAFSNTSLSFGAFDSMHRATLHIANFIPATIAVAEREHASGKDLILATVAGCEVMARVGLALGADEVYRRGFHPTSLCAPFGCAVAAGKLMGLEKEAMAEAISIAAVLGAGARPWPQFPKNPHTTRVQVGRAAQAGVHAPLLARAGINGIREIFEDPTGFLKAHSPDPDLAKLTAGLGTDYEIKKTTMKRFSLGTYIIPGVEAVLEVQRKHGIRGEDVAGMTFKLPSAVVPLVGAPGYPSGDAFGAISKSSRYILAFTAYKGLDGVQYSLAYKDLANVNDPRHIDLFKRIDVIPGPELDQFFPGTWPCVLTVKTKDGQEFTQAHDGSVKGSPENPFTREDVETRFKKVVAPVLSGARAGRMLRLLRGLEDLSDVAPLARLMG